MKSGPGIRVALCSQHAAPTLPSTWWMPSGRRPCHTGRGLVGVRVSSDSRACLYGWLGCSLDHHTFAALLTSSIVFSCIILAISSCLCFSSSYLVNLPSPASGSGGGAKGLLPPAGLVANVREIREVARAAARARGLRALLSMSGSVWYAAMPSTRACIEPAHGRRRTRRP